MSSDSRLRDIMERAEVVSEELVEILFRVSATRSFDTSSTEQALRDAIAELSSFRSGETHDDGWVEHLRSAHQLVNGCVEAPPDEAPPDEALRDSLRDAAAFLDALRGSAIDLVVARDPRAFLAAGSVAPNLEPFLASPGTPATQPGIRLSPPRLFKLTQLVDDPADDDPENEANDDHQAPLVPLRRVHQGKSRGGEPRERMMIEALAREVMEDIGAFANLRLCFDDEPWVNAEPFEKRLLAGLDALMSTARPVVGGRAELDLAEALYGYVTEWSVPDKGRAFAFAFTLANLPQDTALLWVEVGLKGADQRVHGAYVDALSLASSPAIPDRLRSLLGGDTPKDLMLVALQVSLRRRFFHAGTMLPLLAHPDAGVAELATMATANAKTAFMIDALAVRDTEPRLSVRVTQGLVLVLHGEARGLLLLRDLAPKALAAKDDGAARRALRGLAIWGDVADQEVVWRLADATKRYREVGFFGHAAHVVPLFGMIEAFDRKIMENDEAGAVTRLMAQSTDCAAAIHRIAGIELPRFGSGRFDVEAGRALVTAWSPSTSGRLRRDRAFSPGDLAPEMREDKTHQGDRVILADELSLLSKGAFRVDPAGWVTDQRALLEAALQALER